MTLDKKTMKELAELIATTVVNTLEQRGLLGNASNTSVNTSGKSEKTAYQRTEQLLYSYNNFKKIVAERKQEIEDIRKYGVPQKSKSITQYCGNSGGTVQGIVLPEETVENAIYAVQESVQGTVQAIALIDKGMAALRNDPYYCILEMRYFEGRTLEDIAVELNSTAATICRNRSRLVRELSQRLFPDQAVDEIMK